MPPRVAVQTWGTDVAALRRYWEATEILGYDGISYGDGLWKWTHDGWSALGALAAWTRRVRVGPAVTYCFDPSSHHPAWLAKRAATIDHLSAGRLDLRLGVGAPGGELWERHGIRYPPARERVERVEESVAIMRRLWTGERVDFAGRFYALDGAQLEPPPVQRPGPPVWLAAASRRALLAAARCADGWEVSYVAPSTFSRKRSELDRLLEGEGRRPASVRRSVELDVVMVMDEPEAKQERGRFARSRGIQPPHELLEATLCGDAAQVTAQIQAYAEPGATDLMLGFADFPETRMLERFADQVLPRLNGIP